MNKILICPYCGSSEITQTVEIDANSNDIINWYDDYTCTICNKTFKYASELEYETI